MCWPSSHRAESPQRVVEFIGQVEPQRCAIFLSRTDLCVFKGTGARVFAKANKCPLSPGRNFTLEETIKLAANEKNAFAMWGPYEIDKKAFDLAVKRKRLLDTGTINYRADDRPYRKDRVAINCFHAMAGLNELFPNGGLFGTGFKIWGLNGTARVLIEYTKTAISCCLSRWM